MDTQNHFFAKSQLTKSVRFVTALKLTSIKFTTQSSFAAPVVLFALMNSIEEYKATLTGRQKNTVAGTSYSREKNDEVRNVFLSLYHDDETLLSYLNDKISRVVIKRYKGKNEYSNDESKILLNNILKTDLLDNLEL
jgi:hypothetical protein|nr:MAG TPA: hypothetical protein [Crassvirales sp.]